MKNKAAIEKLILDIINILDSVGEINWKNAFLSHYNRILSAANENDYKQAIRDVMGMYGGMGSFSDVVLYSQNRICVKETRKLDKLRKKLYSLVTEVITG